MSRSFAAFAAAFMVIASSCGGSTDSGAASATDVLLDEVTTTAEVSTSTEPAPAGASTTTLAAIPATSPPDAAASTTTAPPAAVPASTTATTAGPPPTTLDLVLRSDGIGRFAFGGVGPAEFVAAVAPTLGTPIQFTSEAYPSDEGSYFENIDDESGFTHPFGETVCFANALCTYFGGASAGAVSFVGYSQDENTSALRTPSGVSSGSIWANFSSAMSVDEGGCFSTGYGRADGVQLVVVSSGEPFEYYDSETDTYVRTTPAQSDVRVISLHAGDRPFYLYEDC